MSAVREMMTFNKSRPNKRINPGGENLPPTSNHAGEHKDMDDKKNKEPWSVGLGPDIDQARGTGLWGRRTLHCKGMHMPC